VIWVFVVLLLVLVVVVAGWAIPRARAARPGRVHVDANAVPPAPASTAGGGVPLMPGADPPPEDPK
jgi:hypothetical protein